MHSYIYIYISKAPGATFHQSQITSLELLNTKLTLLYCYFTYLCITVEQYHQKLNT